VLLENAHDVRAATLHCGTHDEACRVIIRGALQIHGNVSSGDLEPLLSRVTAVLGPIIVSDTDVLHTLDLPLLSKVKGSLIIRANRALVAINTNVRRSAVEGVVNVLSNTHPIQLLSSLDEGSGVRDRTFDVSTTKRFGSAGAAARAGRANQEAEASITVTWLTGPFAPREHGGACGSEREEGTSTSTSENATNLEDNAPQKSDGNERAAAATTTSGAFQAEDGAGEGSSDGDGG